MVVRTILITFDKGITVGAFEDLYNELYNKLTEPPYNASLLGGNLTIDGKIL